MRSTALTFAVLVMPFGAAACGPASSGEPSPSADIESDELLECFDADYPIDPTFDAPEAALEHALEFDAADVPVPDSVDAYESVERSDGWIEFEFRESADHYFIWGMTQHEGGRWGMTSLGGCYPANR